MLSFKPEYGFSSELTYNVMPSFCPLNAKKFWYFYRHYDREIYIGYEKYECCFVNKIRSFLMLAKTYLSRCWKVWLSELMVIEE